MDNAVLYLRLSKEDADKIDSGDDSESIINQRLLLTDYAIEKGFKIVDVYSDDDYSGLYDDRPGFNKLIQDSKLGKFNVVISKSQSRFSRNMEHIEKYLHHDFPLLGIRFIGVVDGVDTVDKNNKKSRQINGLVNEWYCEDLSNNIKAVFKQKMRDGKFLGSFAPYGYVKNPEDKHSFIIDEYAASVVKQIYSMYLDGYSDKAICYYLEDSNVSNPTIYKQQKGMKYKNVKSDNFGKKYNLWSQTTIKRILGDEVYIGKLIQGKYERVSYKDKKVVPVDKSKWIIVENHHEPIIKEELFNKVQKLKNTRRVVHNNQGKDKKYHIFAGKIRCADCGSTMIKSGGVKEDPTKTDRYLRCQLANKTRNKECTSHNIKYSTIEKVVLYKIREFNIEVINNSKYANEIIEAYSPNNIVSEYENQRKKVNRLNDSMEKVIESAKSLYIDKVNGNISSDMFDSLKDNFDNEIQSLKLKISNGKKELERLSIEKNNKRDARELVKKYGEIEELNNEIVNEYIDYIEVTQRADKRSNPELIIHWTF